ncbi:DMT family transporter [Halohasta salina]|uniref:DMT family transporter n=1 Tax=Halohasta salina TaxID=2961621 RepID=UPI002AA2AE5E|nr:DMT family transporter [Halohasta salina]
MALAPLLAAVLWGGMYIVSKWGFDAIPPVTLAFLRVALGAATLLGVVRFVYPTRAFSRQDWTGFGFLGVWVAVTMVTQFVGTDLTTASEGALITVLTPIFTLVFGVVVLDETLTRRNVFGMGLAVCGTGLVLAGQYDLASVGLGSLFGVLLLVLASVGWAVYTVWGKPLIRRYSALETATYSTMLAVPLIGLLVPVELAVADVALSTIPFTLPVVAAVSYLGVLSTAVAWYCWYKGLETLDAGTVAVYFFAQPVVGAGLGALLLGESVGPGFVAGGVILAGGIYLVRTARSE